MLLRLLSLTAAAALAAGFGGGLPDAFARSGASAAESALSGARYIAGRQTPDGGFFQIGTPADQVAEALTATLAAGPAGADVARALERLAADGPARASGKPAYAARIAIALLGSGQDPSAFRGTDYVALSARGYNPATGAFDSNLYANALAMLGSSALGDAAPEAALTYLAANRCSDGGWSWQEACVQGRSEVDTTAMTVVALRAAGAGAGHDLVARAAEWLAAARRPSGGFGMTAADPANANSTGLALLAIRAAGGEPDSAPWTRPGASGPVEDLQSLQEPSGGFRYTRGAKVSEYSTVQAVLGLSGRGLPFRGQGTAAVAAGRAPRSDAQTAMPEAAAAATSSPAEARGAEATPHATGEAATAGGTSGRAGVLVDDGTGQPRRFCPLLEDGDTGLSLLERTGVELTVNVSSLGTSVCRIDAAGCDAGNCFCAFPSFWRYYTRAPGGPWVFSEVGAHQRRPVEGSIDAWMWGGDDSPPPAESESFQTVCAEEAAEAGPTAEAPGEGGTDRAGGFSAGALVAVAGILVAAIVVLVSSRQRNGGPPDGAH